MKCPNCEKTELTFRKIVTMSVREVGEGVVTTPTSLIWEAACTPDAFGISPAPAAGGCVYTVRADDPLDLLMQIRKFGTMTESELVDRWGPR